MKQRKKKAALEAKEGGASAKEDAGEKSSKYKSAETIDSSEDEEDEED